MLPTWPRGKSYCWKSRNWGSSKPNQDWDIDADQVARGSPRNSEEDEDEETFPDSQTWGLRDSAVTADVSEKRKLRLTCIHCMKGIMLG